MSTPTDRTIEVPGGHLAVRTAGERGAGTPVLLLHGIGYNLDIWTEVAPLIAQHTQVVSVDLRGHGQSTARCTAADEMWSDIPRVVTALGLGRTLLVGHDAGAYWATAAAATTPGLAAGVVAIDWPTVLPHEQAVAWYEEVGDPQMVALQAERFSLGATGPDKASMERFLRELESSLIEDWLTGGAGAEKLRSGLRRSTAVAPDGSWLRRPTAEGALAMVTIPADSPAYPDVDLYARLDCPLWLVHPTEGMFADLDAQITEYGRASGHPILRIPAGHSVTESHPEEIADMILEAWHEVGGR